MHALAKVDSTNLIAHTHLMNSIMQYVQDVMCMSRRSQRRRSHYVDADCTVLGWCMASVRGLHRPFNFM